MMMGRYVCVSKKIDCIDKREANVGGDPPGRSGKLITAFSATFCRMCDGNKHRVL